MTAEPTKKRVKKLEAEYSHLLDEQDTVRNRLGEIFKELEDIKMKCKHPYSKGGEVCEICGYFNIDY